MKVVLCVDPKNLCVGLVVKQIKKLDASAKVGCIKFEWDQAEASSSTANMFDFEFSLKSEDDKVDLIAEVLEAFPVWDNNFEVVSVFVGSGNLTAFEIAKELEVVFNISRSSKIWNGKELPRKRLARKDIEVNEESARSVYDVFMLSDMVDSRMIAYFFTENQVRRIPQDHLLLAKLETLGRKIVGLLKMSTHLVALRFSSTFALMRVVPALSDPFSASLLLAFSLAHRRSTACCTLYAHLLLKTSLNRCPVTPTKPVVVYEFRAARDGTIAVDPASFEPCLSTFMKTFVFFFFPKEAKEKVVKDEVIAHVILTSSNEVDTLTDLQKLQEFESKINHFLLEVRKAILIIAPYSSTRFLAETLQKTIKRKGLDLCVIGANDVNVTDHHLSSSLKYTLPHLDECFEFSYTDYLVRESMDLLAKVKANGYEPVEIITGSEPGIPVADYLSHRYRLRTNGLALSPVRRSKYLTHERLAAEGIRSCRQRLCQSVEDILDFVEEYPIIVKAEDGAGSEGVFKCYTDDDVYKAFEYNLGKKNMIGRVNRKVLAQSFLQGTEYVVNVVTHQKKHMLSMIFEYVKVEVQGGIQYHEIKAIPYSFDRNSRTYALYAYVQEVLDCLGVTYGPCHCEVIWTDDGPCLVEVNGRMHGNFGVLLGELAGGFESTQHYLTSDVYLNDGRELQRVYKEFMAGNPPFVIQQNTSILYFNCPVEGLLTRSLEETLGPTLTSLDSYHSHGFTYGKDDRIVVPRDLMTSSGYVILSHVSESRINLDRQLVRVKEAMPDTFQVRCMKTGVMLTKGTTGEPVGKPRSRSMSSRSVSTRFGSYPSFDTYDSMSSQSETEESLFEY